MESVVIDRSPSYPRTTRFGSMDGRLLVSKSFNTTRSNSLLGQNSTTFNASATPSSLLHQPPLLPLPTTTTTGISRSAFPRRPRHKKPFYGEARGVVVIDKSKEKEAAASPPLSLSSSSSLFVCSVSPPPPSSVPMPRFSITRGKKAAAAAAGGSAAGNCVAAATAEENGCGGVVDVCATDGLRRLLRI